MVSHNTPDDNNSECSEIKLPFFRGGTPEEWLVWKNKLVKALDGQFIISTELQRCLFTKKLLTGDAKVTFNQSVQVIGTHTVDNFNKELTEMAKYTYIGT